MNKSKTKVIQQSPTKATPRASRKKKKSNELVYLPVTGMFCESVRQIACMTQVIQQISGGVPLEFLKNVHVCDEQKRMVLKKNMRKQVKIVHQT
ncbi:hypothetical protein ACJX0J_011592, partial [Zea mays]